MPKKVCVILSLESLLPFLKDKENWLWNSVQRTRRAVLEFVEHFRLKYFNMTLQRARACRGKCCWQEWNENEGRRNEVAVGVCVSGLSESLREHSLITLSRKGGGSGGGGGARGKEKHCVIKGQREP